MEEQINKGCTIALIVAVVIGIIIGLIKETLL